VVTCCAVVVTGAAVVVTWAVVVVLGASAVVVGVSAAVVAWVVAAVVTVGAAVVSIGASDADAELTRARRRQAKSGERASKGDETRSAMDAGDPSDPNVTRPPAQTQTRRALKRRVGCLVHIQTIQTQAEDREASRGWARCSVGGQVGRVRGTRGRKSLSPARLPSRPALTEQTSTSTAAGTRVWDEVTHP
jgi:hypothetical protein